jgi:mannosyltransferase PIG-V
MTAAVPAPDDVPPRPLAGERWGEDIPATPPPIAPERNAPTVRRVSTHPMWRTLALVAFAFALSRAVIFAVWFAALQYPTPSQPTEANWWEPKLVLTAPGFGDSLAGLVRLYDASWYATIAEHGYDAGPFDASIQHNWAFFPLHPLLWRAASAATGELALTGIALANLCFLVALIVVHRLTLALDFAPPTADRAVLALALFPVSYFFALPWTESLFLLLSASCFLAATKERWWLAGAFAALASVTRLSGLFLLAALAVVLWQARDRAPRSAWFALALAPLAFAGFAWHLHATTGDALAFVHIQGAFARPAHPTREAIEWAIRRWDWVIEGWNFRWLNAAAMLAAVVAAIWFALKRRLACALFLALGIAAPLGTATVMSGARYAIGLFPFAIAIGAWTKNRYVELALWTISAALLALMSACYALSINFAGA